MIRPVWLALALTLAGCKQRSPTPAPSAPTPASPTSPTSPTDPAALVAGKLPEGAPESLLLQTRCAICHSPDYMTQQRLTEPQWRKTIEKMRRFGAPISDAEASSLTAFLAHHWTPELPDRVFPMVPPPAGAVTP